MRFFRNAYIWQKSRIIWIQLTIICEQSNIGNMERESFCCDVLRKIPVLPSAFCMPCIPVPEERVWVGASLSSSALHLPQAASAWDSARIQNGSKGFCKFPCSAQQVLHSYVSEWVHKGGREGISLGSSSSAMECGCLLHKGLAWSASELKRGYSQFSPNPGLHQALCICSLCVGGSGWRWRVEGISLSPLAVPLFLQKYSVKACRLSLWPGLFRVLNCYASLHLAFTNL